MSSWYEGVVRDEWPDFNARMTQIVRALVAGEDFLCRHVQRGGASATAIGVRAIPQGPAGQPAHDVSTAGQDLK
jgi:hypothetical protein